MNIKNNDFFKIDKYVFILFLFFIIIGWINIYSVGFSFLKVKDISTLFELETFYSKQIVWIGISFFFILVIFLVDYRIFLHMHFFAYVISILLLSGLFFFGSMVKGQVSWYKIGDISLQPSEFSKFTTALLFSFYVSKRGIDLFKTRHILIAGSILFLPVFIILIEPDVGSVLIFSAFLLVLFMMGYYIYLGVLVYLATLFILGILFDKFLVFVGLIIIAIIITIIILLKSKTVKKFRYFLVRIVFGSLLFLGVLNFIWDSILKDRHRDRINITLNLLEDNKGVGYNTYQSKIAVGSGGVFGRGFRQGVYNRGAFVPEKHSDFIFCNIGEEWGFLLSNVFIILYLFFIIRLFRISNRQKNDFVRVYGYSVTSLIFIHFFINISMVLGIMPVIGIPLPFISYGGSSLITFTIMLFVFLRLDVHRADIL